MLKSQRNGMILAPVINSSSATPDTINEDETSTLEAHFDVDEDDFVFVEVIEAEEMNYHAMEERKGHIGCCG